MQQTRLNILIATATSRIEGFFTNPWRRISLDLLGFLSGVFAAIAISTSAGQQAEWDIVIAGLFLLFTELVSRLSYGRNSPRRSLWLEVLNLFKIGMVYSLFLQALILGS